MYPPPFFFDFEGYTESRRKGRDVYNIVSALYAQSEQTDYIYIPPPLPPPGPFCQCTHTGDPKHIGIYIRILFNGCGGGE